MRRVIAPVLVLLVSATMLTGCYDESQARQDRIDRELDLIKIGKECADAGGTWSWSEWSGWRCEFL